MAEQVNIPALGIVCFVMRTSKACALYGYTSRKGKVMPQGIVNASWKGAQKSNEALGDINPYRKPTQVGRSSRPRRTRET